LEDAMEVEGKRGVRREVTVKRGRERERGGREGGREPIKKGL
jgi:hypothetical protein